MAQANDVARNAVFVDTSAWYALADAGDRNHVHAGRVLRRLLADRRTLLTTNHVVGESYTLLRVRLGFRAAQQFLQLTRRSAYADRVFVPQSWEEAVEDLLEQFHDHDLSYVDGTSFVAMRRLRLQEAFTFDHHFAILGFVPVSYQE